MANGLYYEFRNGQLGKGTYTPIDFSSPGGNGLKLVLTDHTGAEGAPDITTDDFYDDIDGSTVNSLSTALSSLTVGTVAVGVFDAADLSPAFTTVSGNTVESVSLLRDTGTASSNKLIGYWDTASGLPLTPNGGDVNVSFNASGIFKF